jgi:hypothetical protein
VLEFFIDPHAPPALPSRAAGLLPTVFTKQEKLVENEDACCGLAKQALKFVLRQIDTRPVFAVHGGAGRLRHKKLSGKQATWTVGEQKSVERFALSGSNLDIFDRQSTLSQLTVCPSHAKYPK